MLQIHTFPPALNLHPKGMYLMYRRAYHIILRIQHGRNPHITHKPRHLTRNTQIITSQEITDTQDTHLYLRPIQVLTIHGYQTQVIFKQTVVLPTYKQISII